MLSAENLASPSMNLTAHKKRPTSRGLEIYIRDHFGTGNITTLLSCLYKWLSQHGVGLK
jgi:hypothetical protein